LIFVDRFIILLAITKSQGDVDVKQPAKLYEGNMRKKYLLFAIPLILSSLLAQSCNMINSIMIGKFVGGAAFAATATTAQLIEFINSIFFGYLTGVGIYVSILYGKNERQKMLNVIKVNFLITSALALLISLAGNIFCAQIFDFLNVGADVYEDAKAYFTTYMAGMLFFQFNWGFVYISNGMGMTTMPLAASVFSGLGNITLNYLFLAVLNKNIGYSALATLLSSAIVTIFYFTVYIRLFRGMDIPLKGIRLDLEELKQVFSYGAPSLLQQITMTGCTAIVSPLTNTCSTVALSGYSVANKAHALILAIYQGSSKANTNMVAQAMGAGRIDKIKQGIRIGFVQGLSFFGVTLGLFMSFAPQFTGLFLDPASDYLSFTISINTIRFLFPFIIFNMFNNLFHGIFRAIGNGALLFVSTLIYAVSYVLYAYILFAVLPQDYKIYGVHLAMAGAYITEVIFTTIMYFTGRWKTTEYKELELKTQV